MSIGAVPRVTTPPGAAADVPGQAGPPTQPHWQQWARRVASGTGWTWALAAALFALYATVSIRRHQQLRSTGFDLGIVEQAVRSYASWGPPIVEVKGPGASHLGDHFAPVLATLAPLYRVFPGPVTLLVAQAALLAVAAVPIARYAQRVLGFRAALVMGLGYGLSWGIAGAVGFDVHDVAFAVPLLAFSTIALAERRWTAAALWALPLLAVKEDLGITVAAVGALIAWSGRRLLGAATAAAGLLGTALAVLVVLPANSPEGSFSAWWDAHGGGDPTQGGTGNSLEGVTVGLVSAEPKVALLVLMVAPTAMVALRSPLLLLTLPTLAWRLHSDYEQYWDTGYHYSAVLMPVVFVAFVDGLRRWRLRVGTEAGTARMREALTVSAVVTALLLPAYPLWSAVRPSTWQDDTRVRDARALLEQIPDDALVSASNRLVPQLASRTTVSVFGHPDSRPNPEYVVVDTAAPVNWPFAYPRAQAAMLEQATELGYTVIGERGDFRLFYRSAEDDRTFPAPPEEGEAPAPSGLVPLL